MSAVTPAPEPPPTLDRRVLLLDFDGTLVDSLGFLRLVYARFVRSLGGAPSTAEFESLNGPPIAEVVDRLCRRHQASGSSREHVRRYEALIDRGFAALPMMRGASALLRAAARLGVPSYIITANRCRRVQQWLEANGLARLCRVLVSGDDRVEPKPSAAPYLLALHRLGLVPHQAVAIEDSDAGSRAASLAGIETIKLGAGHDDQEGAIHFVRDLAGARRLFVQIAAR